MLKEKLMAENEALKKQVAQLEQRVSDLEQALADKEKQLKEALAQLEAKGRAGKGQAAPFSCREKKEKPKQPGRKKGHQPAHRAKPQLETIKSKL